MRQGQKIDGKMNILKNRKKNNVLEGKEKVNELVL